MRVALFVTCLVDQLWPSVGTATVRVLERAGCEVLFDERQTCCGQPAFNSGYRDEARTVARAFLEVYGRDDAEALVLPSGSCAAMVHHMAELFDESDPWHARAKAVAARTHELGAFLVNVLGVDDVGATFAGRVTWHDACHGLRDLGIREEPRRLLAKVRGIEFVEASSAESCCGFGGTFSVKYPAISVAMLDQKLQALELDEVDTIVSGDVSCLMQIGGRLARRKSPIRTLHLAELLASER
ncbi:MAG: (Fe-S)-binding protein [Planctomycetota bacterium]|nr:MAG: (Fe-S)-binding protein [Planctomycetota bacterium]